MGKKVRANPVKFFSGRPLHFAFILIAGIGSFVIFLPYADKVTNDEGVFSFLYACYSLIGVYMGRYISLIWLARYKLIPDRQFIILLLIILLSAIWLFFHMDFPVQHRISINILLSILPLTALTVSTGILIKLIRATIENQVKTANVSAEQSLSELRFLQSQLSPHFLFNTLNNLYGISITKHERIPGLLLKLSDLLRYSVYEGKEPFVPLIDEIGYIKNYIDFERLRIGDRLILHSEIEDVTNPTIRIAPLLLIVFIENAFKHAKNTTDEHIRIELSLRINGSNIVFDISNSFSKDIIESAKLNSVSQNGIGLANTMKRLELLYGENYELQTGPDLGLYHVALRIPIR